MDMMIWTERPMKNIDKSRWFLKSRIHHRFFIYCGRTAMHCVLKVDSGVQDVTGLITLVLRGATVHFDFRKQRVDNVGVDNCFLVLNGW